MNTRHHHGTSGPRQSASLLFHRVQVQRLLDGERHFGQFVAFIVSLAFQPLLLLGSGLLFRLLLAACSGRTGFGSSRFRFGHRSDFGPANFCFYSAGGLTW
eukprot:Gregarina_sp_Pseudo_9__4016@NODE_4159_length_475_cov_5_456422_g3830_i0_p2_GENE_NODE_4159_length_475_cov_5_456422_g3830_i0NODE_4159_length_475_cov_5_456422_g3830_i0_p2_ORF_typecomplete_len101_score14_63CreA/PF05981_12/0_28_NODE_4159_length_475_cov_5_456422_g3830_i0149451